MKEWIGVPQSVVSKNVGTFVGRRAKNLPSTKLLDLLQRTPKSDDRAKAGAEGACRACRSNDPELKKNARAIHDVIHQYMYGDALELKMFEPLLDLNISFELPIWFFERVVVENGGVLEFGSGLNTLATDILIIENGGEIRCSGSLKITCRRMARS